MDHMDLKCVFIIDRNLPLGLIANTSGILGCSLGKFAGSIVGEDIVDNENIIHKGIVNIPIPILSSTKTEIKKLYNIIAHSYKEELMLIDFCDIAQKCKVYEDYIEKLSCTAPEDLNYLGICIYGNKKIVNSLVGSLPTLK